VREIPGLNDFELNFSDGNLIVLQLSIAFIMFAVALSIKYEHFTLLLKKPKPVIVGLASQLILLPAITFVLIKLISPPVGIGMGMILIAVCPGGNVSNFYTMVARGNVALSVSLTSIISVVSIVTIPFLFALWAGIAFPDNTSIMLSVSPSEMILNVFLIMGVPLIAGLFFTHKLPNIAARIAPVTKWLSFAVLIGFLTIAVSQNTGTFISFTAELWPLVALHNASAFAGGFILAKIMKCSLENVRAICFETGIQNVTIALGLVFAFFDGNGAMAVITAIWGVWHLIAGATLSAFFLIRSRKAAKA
jgi:BASS family bile acid:Na+ symporter